MSVDEESTSCYCLLEAHRCHVLLEQPGRYALVGEPLSPEAAKRLRLAVFGSPDNSSSLGFILRVYCVDDTPHAFQVRGRERLMSMWLENNMFLIHFQRYHRTFLIQVRVLNVSLRRKIMEHDKDFIRDDILESL